MEEIAASSTGPEQEPVKLFVGQVPKDMDDDSLRVFFKDFGPVTEVSVIRDSNTMAHKGCAFVTFVTAWSAEKAINDLHDKVKLPNSTNFLQVRIAESHTERENKLFIGMLPKTINEQDLHDMFITFGELKEVHIIRGPEGSPKGCAFVKFVSRQSAVTAIENMNEIIPEGGTRPLVVKFADTKKQNRTGGRADTQEAAGVAGPRAATNPWFVQQANGGPGISPAQQRVVPHLYSLSHPQQQTMMGMPYMQYGSQTPQGAPPGAAPVQDQRYMLMDARGYYSPAGQYAMSPQQQHHQQQQQHQQQAQSYGRGKPMQSKPSYRVAQGSSGSSELVPGEHDGQHTRPPEGPSGANLFIYHLPRDITDADLATLFAPFGNVISAKVFVDKKTSDSKGFGFVSYDTLESANSAIESMNGFQIGSKRLKVQHKRVISNSASSSAYEEERHYNQADMGGGVRDKGFVDAGYSDPGKLRAGNTADFPFEGVADSPLPQVQVLYHQAADPAAAAALYQQATNYGPAGIQQGQQLLQPPQGNVMRPPSSSEQQQHQLLQQRTQQLQTQQMHQQQQTQQQQQQQHLQSMPALNSVQGSAGYAAMPSMAPIASMPVMQPMTNMTNMQSMQQQHMQNMQNMNPAFTGKGQW